MENDNIMSKVATDKTSSQIREKASKELSSYGEVYSLIERTYIAMGKKKSYNYSAQSSSNGNINTRAVSSTSEI